MIANSEVHPYEALGYIRNPQIRERVVNSLVNNGWLIYDDNTDNYLLTNQARDHYGLELQREEDTAEELNNASIFKNVFFSHNIQDGDWYLQGNLIKSKYSVANTFYGLSLPGDLLWVLGLPSGKIKNEIEIEYKLMDKNYNIYFQKKYAESSSCYQGLYYNLTSFQFENLLKKINMRLIEDLHLIIPNLKKK